MDDSKIPPCRGLAQIGNYIFKLCKDRALSGSVNTITIKRDKLNDLYLYFSLEVDEPKPGPMSGKMAGFDFGLRTFLTVSDGVSTYKIESPQFFKQGLNEIRRANRSLSRKVKGSNNRRRANRGLAKAHKQIADKRLDWFFKLANELTDRYDYLFFETLNLKGMQRLWGRKVSDLAFGTFLTVLQWMAQKKGKVVAFVDRFFPCSKMCHQCGSVNHHLSLNDRRWRCPDCQEIVDRDGNASVNILREGASSLGVGDIRPLLLRPSLLIPEPHVL